MTRLFVAVWPTGPVAEALADIARPTERGVRYVTPLKWHITLRFIGDADVDEVAERLGQAALPGAAARLGPQIEMLGPRQAVVPVEGVEKLATAVRAATGGIGQTDRQQFRGHLTIARLGRGTRPSVLGTLFGAEFDITEVALVSSELHHDGSIYTTVNRFPTT